MVPRLVRRAVAATATDPQAVVVDDTSAAITYSAGWAAQPAAAAAPSVFNSTWHAASVPADAGPATASFSFNGTAVSVTGVIPPAGTGAPVNLAFMLDGQIAAPFTYTPVGTQYVPNLQFFAQKELPPGAHTLQIVANPNSSALLDSITYTPLSTLSPGVDTAPAITPAPPPVEKPHRAPGAAIAGGVLGALALLLVVLAVLVSWRRRRVQPVRTRAPPSAEGSITAYPFAFVPGAGSAGTASVLTAPSFARARTGTGTGTGTGSRSGTSGSASEGHRQPPVPVMTQRPLVVYNAAPVSPIATARRPSVMASIDEDHASAVP